MRFTVIVTVLLSLFLAVSMSAQARYHHRYYRNKRCYTHERPVKCCHPAPVKVVYTNHYHSYYAGPYNRNRVRAHRFGHGYHNGYKHCGAPRHCDAPNHNRGCSHGHGCNKK